MTTTTKILHHIFVLSFSLLFWFLSYKKSRGTPGSSTDWADISSNKFISVLGLSVICFCVPSGDLCLWIVIYFIFIFFKYNLLSNKQSTPYRGILTIPFHHHITKRICSTSVNIAEFSNAVLFVSRHTFTIHWYYFTVGYLPILIHNLV